MKSYLTQCQNAWKKFRASSRTQKYALLFNLLGWAWVSGVSITVFRMAWGTFSNESSWQLGWKRLLEQYNPFDILNIILVIILLLPAIASFLAKEHFDQST